MFFIFFLLVAGFFIISNENIKLNSSDNINKFFLAYSKWLDRMIENEIKVAGYIVKMEWLPGNEE